MKKIIFFTLQDEWMGGVASVNAALESALVNDGVEVKNLFLRGCLDPLPPSENNRILRKNCPWNFIYGRDILSALKSGNIFTFLSLAGKRIWDTVRNRLDLMRAKRVLRKENPDLILVSSYLLLDGVPKKLRPRTLHHVHTSLEATLSQRENRKTLFNYNGKIGFLWLTQGICNKARELGFSPSFFLYNPLKEFPEERSAAEESDVIVLITRFSSEKRLPLAVELLKKALDSLPDPNRFSVELWGTGPEDERIRSAIGSDVRFALKGYTKDPLQVLSRARFTLNTSLFEGFSISVLEAAAAGIPTLSFRFGEGAEEEILHGKTGFLVEMDDNTAFLSHLKALLEDDALVKTLSLGAREFSRRFRKEEIARELQSLLLSLPLDKTEKP